MIHTFGDSHCCGAFACFPQIKIHHLGPVLAYSFGKDKLKRLNIKDYDVKENDTVLFSFGEIDCRCHINKHITTDNTFENIIDNIIINYFEAIKENIIQYNNINTIIYNVVPPPQLFNTWVDLGYPFLGTDEERKSYVLYFNKQLKNYCLKYNYIFFDIYDAYIDVNGYLNKVYSDDHVHINNCIYISEFLKTILQ